MRRRSHSEADSNSPSLKWQPQTPDGVHAGKVAKQRAKELRKEGERRAEKRQEQAFRRAEARAQKASADQEVCRQQLAGIDLSDDSSPPSARRSSASLFDLEGEACLRRPRSSETRRRSQSDPLGYSHCKDKDETDQHTELELVSPFDMLSEELWLEVLSHLDALSVNAATCTNTELQQLTTNKDALWLTLYERIFGEAAPPSTGAALRRCCGKSERTALAWTQPEEGSAAARPSPLPLTGMTALWMDGEKGVSTEGKWLRLWEAGNGRRIAGNLHKQVLLSVHVSGSHAVVGDAVGAVHLYDMDASFEPRTLMVGRDDSAVSACLLPQQEEELGALVVVVGTWAGQVRVLQEGLRTPMRELNVVEGPAALAAGSSANLAFVTSPQKVLLYDLEAGVAAWDLECDGLGAHHVPGIPVRPTFFSSNLGLLASAVGGGVALWDVRTGKDWPVTQAELPEGTACWTQLDDWKLLATDGQSGVHILDMRVVAGSGGHVGPRRLGVLAPGQAVGCFHAVHTSLVMGCSEKGGPALRWELGAAATTTVESASPTGSSPGEEEGGRGRKAKNKPKRGQFPKRQESKVDMVGRQGSRYN